MTQDTVFPQYFNQKARKETTIITRKYDNSGVEKLILLLNCFQRKNFINLTRKCHELLTQQILFL